MLRLTQVAIRRVEGIHAESPTVGGQVRASFRNSSAGLSENVLTGIAVEWHSVNRRQPHADVQSRRERTNPLHYLAQKARAAFEGAAVATLAWVRAENFVAEGAAAMFDFAYCEDHLPGNHRRP